MKPRWHTRMSRVLFYYILNDNCGKYVEIATAHLLPNDVEYYVEVALALNSPAAV